jgi:DNA invertase Pin-like site-specific DNA recombinase
MAANPIKPVRCAIYTRKSTEHGLEQEFNSLDAQRDACEAYIKSQASQGWRALSQHYDDPAYSGGNLDRPALQKLLGDIDAGRIDVIVVYKIDRLTRSLADFAKLVEAFDAKSISFVAVTQQFNTTTSMGRLTLNVLLSFAQFERELSSERVRDKVAASRRKGKWTGGTVPLGYDAKDKKLVINKAEAETVRYIFKRYLELQSFGKLVQDLDRRAIVTKRRDTKVRKYNGGIPFTYGPLAHFLKNRLYIGETGHKDKWFPGEHAAIVDRETFEQVQQLLGSKSAGRKAQRTASEALLMGKLYDDRGNRMSPSFSTKNGIRYRFYVSTALLRGRKDEIGSLGRVPAVSIESAVLQAVRRHTQLDRSIDDAAMLDSHLLRVELAKNQVTLLLRQPDLNAGSAGPLDKNDRDVEELNIKLPRSSAANQRAASIENNTSTALTEPDPKMVQTIVRALRWADALTNRQTLQDLGYLPNIRFNTVIDAALARQGLRRSDIYVTQTFHLIPRKRSERISQAAIRRSFDEVTRFELQGRKVIALGDIAASECARHSIEHIAVCHPSRRGYTNEQNATEIAEAIAALGFGRAVKARTEHDR